MKKILVPIDFSKVSAYGTTLAVKIANYMKSEIRFVHVINLPSHILLTPEGELFEDGDFDTSVQKLQKEKALLNLEDWKSKYFPTATTSVVYGHVNDTILGLIKKENFDLVVMGTHAVSGLSEFLSHTHGEYLAMHSPVPVMTLKCDRSDMQIKKIVLASSFKNPDVPHAESLVKLVNAFNAKLYLLRINTPADFISDSQIYKNMDAFIEKHGINNVEKAIYNDHHVEDGIVHYVAQEDIDIIGIGSWQRTGLNKLINGCVSSDLLNHVFKPIFTFKLKDA